MEKPCESCSWIDVLKNSGEAVKNAVVHKVKNGTLTLEQDKVEARLKVCGECEYLDGSRCKACGCFIKFKALLASEKCPHSKWEEAQEEG